MRNIIFTFLFIAMSLTALGFSAYLLMADLPKIDNQTTLSIFSLLGAIIYGFVAGNNITTIIKEESI